MSWRSARSRGLLRPRAAATFDAASVTGSTHRTWAAPLNQPVDMDTRRRLAPAAAAMCDEPLASSTLTLVEVCSPGTTRRILAIRGRVSILETAPSRGAIWLCHRSQIGRSGPSGAAASRSRSSEWRLGWGSSACCRVVPPEQTTLSASRPSLPISMSSRRRIISRSACSVSRSSGLACCQEAVSAAGITGRGPAGRSPAPASGCRPPTPPFRRRRAGRICPCRASAA